MDKNQKRVLLSAELNPDGSKELTSYSGNSPKFASEKQRLVSQCKAIVKSRVLQSRENPNAFMEYCFRDSETGAPLKQADIHREFQDVMASGDDSVNLYPRDHGKTTQKEGHAIWRLGNDPSLRIKIVCASDAKAVERLFAIIQHIKLNDRVKDVFPWLRPAKLGDWTKHKIVVERPFISRDASIEALGVLSTATGGRTDLLFADDVVDRRNSLELPKLRETVKSAWDSDWVNLLEPNAQVIYTGTPWHTADLTHKLCTNSTYRVVKRPVGNGSDHFAPIWPEKWDRETLMRRRMKIGQVEFDRGFRLIALSGDVATVKEDWIHFWDSPPDLGQLLVFAAFDVSSGVGKDFFACVVVGVDPSTGAIFVLEAWHGKLTFLGRAEAIKDTVRRWQPHLTGLEEETMKSLSQYLDETTAMSLIKLRPHMSKSIRLMAVTPPMERGQVLFNPALNPANLGNPDEHGSVIGELLDFPLGANDDLVDAFVHAIMLAQAYGQEDRDRGFDLGISVIGVSQEGVGLLDIGDSESFSQGGSVI